MRRTRSAARAAAGRRGSKYGASLSGVPGLGARRQPANDNDAATARSATAIARAGAIKAQSLQGDRGLGVDLFFAADHAGRAHLVLVPFDETHVRRDRLTVELDDLLVGLDADLGEIDLVGRMLGDVVVDDVDLVAAGAGAQEDHHVQRPGTGPLEGRLPLLLEGGAHLFLRGERAKRDVADHDAPTRNGGP